MRMKKGGGAMFLVSWIFTAIMLIFVPCYCLQWQRADSFLFSLFFLLVMNELWSRAKSWLFTDKQKLEDFSDDSEFDVLLILVFFPF